MKKTPFSLEQLSTPPKFDFIDLQRDQCVVIKRTGNLPALKKHMATMKKILSKMPANTVDTVEEVRAFREARGC